MFHIQGISSARFSAQSRLTPTKLRFGQEKGEQQPQAEQKSGSTHEKPKRRGLGFGNPFAPKPQNLPAATSGHREADSSSGVPGDHSTFDEALEVLEA